MCFLTCEDRSGTADCVVFPSLYPAVRQYLEKEAVLCIRGKLTQKEETVSVLCDSILTEEGFRRTMSQGRLCIKTDSRQTEKLHALAALVQQYPGGVPVCFYLTDRKKMLSLRGGQAMAVQPESMLHSAGWFRRNRSGSCRQNRHFHFLCRVAQILHGTC